MNFEPSFRSIFKKMPKVKSSEPASSDAKASTPSSSEKETITTPSSSSEPQASTESKISSYKDRLFKLQMRANQSKQDNIDHVLQENEELDYKKKPFYKHKNVLEKEMENTNITLEDSSEFDKKRKRSQKPKPQGWEVRNSDSLYENHKKRVKQTISQEHIEEYKRGGAIQSEETSILSYGSSLKDKVSEESKEAMASELKEKIEKSKNFSRERTLHEDENVYYINKTNQSFAKSLSKSYDKYTEDIRGNLERGTAM